MLAAHGRSRRRNSRRHRLAFALGDAWRRYWAPFLCRWFAMRFNCFFLLLATLALAGCDRIDPDSPLGKRKALFNEMLNTSEELGGMLRGRVPFNAGAFQDGAAKLDTLAHAPWQHFPQVMDSEGSSARDEVWQRQARFQELARELEAATGELRVTSREAPQDKRQLRPAVQKVEDACEGCHKEFRIY